MQSDLLWAFLSVLQPLELAERHILLHPSHSQPILSSLHWSSSPFVFQLTQLQGGKDLVSVCVLPGAAAAGMLPAAAPPVSLLSAFTPL